MKRRTPPHDDTGDHANLAGNLRMAFERVQTRRFDQCLDRLMTHMDQTLTQTDQPAMDEPLPPLDDLEEGLICCDRTYATFRAFLTHRRQHREG